MPIAATIVGRGNEFDAMVGSATALRVGRYEHPARREGDISGAEVVRALVRVGEHLTRSATLEDRMTLLCQETVTLLGCDRSSIMLWDGESYRAAYNWGNPPDIAKVFESYRIPAHAPLMVEMETTGSFVVINEAATHRSVSGIAAAARIRSIVVAPMVDNDGDRLGFLTAEFNEHLGTFDDCRAEIVLGVARLAQTAVATDRERRHRHRADADREAMLARLVNAEDEERRRFSHELHDDLMQRLYSLQLRLETAAAELYPSQLLDLDRLVLDAQAASKSLRGLLSDVHPTAIDGKTLGEALQSALQRKAGTSGWTTVVIDELTSPPPTANLTVLFRISLQAFHNTAIHATASTVTVRLRTVDGGSELRITDDGCGFDPTEVSEDRFGLTSMAERASGAGGWFDLVSHAGQGTVVTVWLPNGKGTS